MTAQHNELSKEEAQEQIANARRFLKYIEQYFE